MTLLATKIYENNKIKTDLLYYIMIFSLKKNNNYHLSQEFKDLNINIKEIEEYIKIKENAEIASSIWK